MKKRLTALALAVMLLLFSGCTSAISLTELPSQRESVEEFFACLKREDYAGADDLVYNYVTLGMEKVTASDSDSDAMIDELFYELLRDSRKYTIDSVGEIKGRETTVSITYSSIDYRKIHEPLDKKVTALIKDRKFQGEKFDDEGSVMPVILEQLKELTEVSSADLVTTEQYELQMQYSGKKWRICLTDDFYRGLIGYAV